MKKYIIFILVVALATGLLPMSQVHAFGQSTDGNTYGAHGFLFGLWHGLLAPWSLIARIFIPNTVMYFSPNTGFGYDLGYLLGAGGSIPAGWLAAIISAGQHIFVY